MLDVQAFLGLRQRDVLAHVPQRVRLRRGSRRPRRRSTQPSLQRGLEQALELRARVRLRLAVGVLEQHAVRRRSAKRHAQLREVLAPPGSSANCAHHLEAGQAGAELACASASSAHRRIDARARAASAVSVAAGLRIQLQRRRGDDAQRAFAADEQVAQVVAGVVLAQAASGRPRPRPAPSRLPGPGTARARCRSAAPACRRRWSPGCRRSCSCPRRPGSGERSRPAVCAASCTALQHAAGLDGHRQVGGVDRADAVHARAGSAPPACRCVRHRPTTRPVLPPCGTMRVPCRGAGVHHRGDFGRGAGPHHGERLAAVALAPVELPGARGRRR